MSAPNQARHKVLIIGGGAAGITVAARLRRAGVAPSRVPDLGPVCRVTKGRAESGSADVASFYAGHIAWVASCGRVADDTAVFG